jgi:hypothetical protein
MTGTSNWQFGLIVAYVLPGFIGLAGLAPLLPAVAGWLRPTSQGSLDLGAPVYAILAATATGLVLSNFRWLLLDQVLYWTGVQRPTWNDTQLASVLGAFDYLVQNHYRYYEFSGNTLIALLWAYGMNRIEGTVPFLGPATDLGMAIILLVLFAASRDALSKYYTRTGLLLGPVAEKDFGRFMYNGNDHGSSAGPTKPTEPKPVQEKPQEASKSEQPKSTPTDQRS